MNIPDEFVAQLGGEAVHGEPERRALEAFVPGEFKANRISKVQLRKLLGL